MLAGVALNPHTSVSLLQDLILDIDLVCVMSVNPGFGGQKFIANTFNKVKELSVMAKNLGKDLMIEIDGGVTLENYKQLLQAGANVLVAGNTVFASSNPSDTIRQLKTI
jgi:ribulose-phosphate 3-epimerase